MTREGTQTRGEPLILAFDVGTTAMKTCLYSMGKQFRLEVSARAEYSLSILENGGAEQDPEEWFEAIVKTCREIFIGGEFSPESISGISFCSQMQGLVLVDRNGKALRPSMSYMDGRGREQKRAACYIPGTKIRGPAIEGIPPFKLLNSIAHTGIAPTSVKDPIWRYQWVRENEPEVFAHIYKWLDVKEYLIMKLTGRAVMTPDSACATFLYDNRPGRNCWSRSLCRQYRIDHSHMPEMIAGEDEAGPLQAGVAKILGLPGGIPVFGGGGDASLIGLGSGCVDDKDGHIYLGTSAWVSSLTSKRILDLKYMIGSITCSIPDRYNYFCEQETGGKCMEWVCNHLAQDEIGIYLEKKEISADPDSIYKNLFEYLNEVVSKTRPGCGGLLFTPWLHGSRSPFEDPNARGMFFNIGLNTGKSEMVRAVVEGLAYNLKWMLSSLERKCIPGERIRFVGGGALSKVTGQILADITGRTLEVPENPQNSGALGAAVIGGIGLGKIESFRDIPSRIPIEYVYYPTDAHKEVYDRNYRVFRDLYRSNRRSFSILNN
ncbi:MAG: FGGY-family carbohydrate kinase [Spirochaetales bacterium]|nr:FGGY-family carbohydrate kinase [Spirochaetales bacterium]